MLTNFQVVDIKLFNSQFLFSAPIATTLATSLGKKDNSDILVDLFDAPLCDDLGAYNVTSDAMNV